MSNRDELNNGFPNPADPPQVRDKDLRYGNALLGAFGTEDRPTGFGNFLRRIGSVQTGLTVTSHVVDVGPGAVLAVQATTATSTGPKTMIMSGVPAGGQVLVAPQADGTQRLTFAAGDAVTEAAVYLLAVASDLLDFLEDTTDPPP